MTPRRAGLPQGVGASLPARLSILAAWLALAGFLAAHHVVWRDEVRALSFALSGDSIGEMLATLHGEGHPALWYLMLRGLHALIPQPQILVVTGFAIGALTAALFALRAPFGWPLLALAMFGRFFVYEYSVVARNYGLATLLLFALAACYRRYRTNGWLMGGLLFLLCNANVPAVMLAAGFLLFWLLDLRSASPAAGPAHWRAFAIAAALALIGAIACAITVYPPFNDAAPQKLWHDSVALTVARMAPLIGKYYLTLLPREIQAASVFVLPFLLYGSLLRWWRSDAALAGLAGMIALLAVSALVYKGYYRHQAMVLPWLLTVAWLQAEGHGRGWLGQAVSPRDARRVARLRRIGGAAFALLLLAQVAWTIPYVTRALRGMPESRSAELAQLLDRPALKGAIVISDPDFMVEPIPYYADNPTCFTREPRCGRWAIFSKAAASREITPDTILATADRLSATTGRKIVILIADPLFRSGVPGHDERGTYGPLRTTAAGLDRFRHATRRLISYPHVTDGDESYDVYLYAPPAAQHACAPREAPLCRAGSRTGGV